MVKNESWVRPASIQIGMLASPRGGTAAPGMLDDCSRREKVANVMKIRVSETSRPPNNCEQATPGCAVLFPLPQGSGLTQNIGAKSL